MRRHITGYPFPTRWFVGRFQAASPLRQQKLYCPQSNGQGTREDYMLSESAEGEKNRLEVSIRQMEIDDIASVYHLGETLFTSEEFPILYRTWDPYEVADYFLVAEADDRVVGFIMATTIEKEGTAWKKYGYVSWIGVDEDFQGTTLARRRYKRVEERLKENGGRMIIVDTEGAQKR